MKARIVQRHRGPGEDGQRMTDSTQKSGRGILRLSIILPAVLIAGSAATWLLRGPHDGTTRVSLCDITSSGSARGFNLLLVTLDTTRPDHLGCYHARTARTPVLDRLAKNGVRFDDAVTSAPTTLASHATIMTGLYPPVTGVRDNGICHLAPGYDTLAEAMKGAGYDTAAFVSSFVLDRRFGLDQGFDHYGFQMDEDLRKGPASLEHERRASSVTNEALGWLRSRKETSSPFFMWVHYFDAHYPYESPLGGPKSGLDPYSAEIAFVDIHLGRLLGELEKQSLADRTVVAVVTDHGESLSEHGERLHGIFVYESTVHVGFVLSNPVLFDRAYRVDDRVVGTVDVAPTLLDLLGLSLPKRTNGMSLVASQPAADRAVYIETVYPLDMGCAPLYGLRTHREKLILAPTSEFYDLRRDPKETTNLFSRGGDRLRALQDQLAELERTWLEESRDRDADRSLSEDERRRLESLGYLATNVAGAGESLPDAKDRIELIDEVTKVVQLLASDRLEEALALANELIDRAGDWTTPTLMAAEALMRLGRTGERVAVLERFCEHKPTAEMLYYLGHALLAAKRYDECEVRLRQAETLDPELGAVPALRGDLYVAQGRFADAIAEYERAIEMDGDRLGDDVRIRLVEAKSKLEQASQATDRE